MEQLMWSVFRLGFGSEILIQQPVYLPHSACFVGQQGQEAEMRTVEEMAGASRFLLWPMVIRPGLRVTVFAVVVAARMQPFELVETVRGPVRCCLAAFGLVATV